MKTQPAYAMSTATFNIAELPPAWPSPAAGEASAGVGRVLVVDDDAPSRTMLADWLSAYGHEVSTAADGPAGLRLAEEKAPDAIVLDVTMPGMDGFAVCQQLKGNPRTAMVPVRRCSASSR